MAFSHRNFLRSLAEESTKIASEGAENPLAHGIGGDIDWIKWDRAIDVAKDLKKPIMLIMLKSTCGFCKTAKSDKFVALSKKFVMVNVEDDEVPRDPKYAPDGRYVPRILFLDYAKGNRTVNVFGEHNNNYQTADVNHADEYKQRRN